MKHIILSHLIGILFLLPSSVFCQNADTLIVDLQITSGYGPFFFGFKNTSVVAKDSQDFKGLESFGPKAMIWRFNVQNGLEYYKKFKSGTVTEEEFFQRMGEDVDMNNFTTDPVSSYIYFLVKRDSEEKIVVVDANHNLDFSDDQAFHFELDLEAKEKEIFTMSDPRKGAEYRNSLPTVLATYQYFYQGHHRSDSVWMKVNPFNSMIQSKDSLENKLRATLELYQYRSGSFELPDGRKMNIGISKGAANAFFSNIGSAMVIGNEGMPLPDLKQDYEELVQFGEGYYAEPFLITPLRVHPLGESLIIEVKRMTEIPPKAFPGFQAPPMRLTDLNDNPFDLEDFRGEYVLLDFWGTWCGPCVAEIPILKEAYSSLPTDGWKFYGVAVDKNAEVVQNFVKEQSIPWRQIFLSQRAEETQTFLSSYRIRSFPTYILIGPDGTVLARGGGSDLENIISTLAEKLE